MRDLIKGLAKVVYSHMCLMCIVTICVYEHFNYGFPLLRDHEKSAELTLEPVLHNMTIKLKLQLEVLCMMIVMTVGCLAILRYVLVGKNLIFDQQLMHECLCTFILLQQQHFPEGAKLPS